MMKDASLTQQMTGHCCCPNTILTWKKDVDASSDKVKSKAIPNISEKWCTSVNSFTLVARCVTVTMSLHSADYFLVA